MGYGACGEVWGKCGESGSKVPLLYQPSALLTSPLALCSLCSLPTNADPSLLHCSILSAVISLIHPANPLLHNVR